MTGRWDNSGGDHGFPLERPSLADYRDLDDTPPATDFDAAEDAPSLAQWPWTGSLPIGGEM